MEIRELLTEYGFDGDETPVISGSALCTLEDKSPEIGLEAIRELIKVMDIILFDFAITMFKELKKEILLKHQAFLVLFKEGS